LTRTTPTTHAVVEQYLHLSPIRTGAVQGKGPRYCPSIDRKVINFPEKEHHPVFVEPEGIFTNEVYLQGLTTSLPVWVQKKVVRATPGLEKARLTRPGYAVVYDYLPPQQLRLSLETKAVAGLFAAGQINGTSGYEEAAAQGLMAGINAARYAKGEAPLILRRDQAYIGVLIDDLVTKGVDEPYRMFTSRAEYRLLLRHDNADLRLAAVGHELGLISGQEIESVECKQEEIERCGDILARTTVRGSAETNRILESLGTSPLSESQTITQLLRRPQLSLADILALLPEAERRALQKISGPVVQQLEISAQYDGYIERQLSEVKRHSSTELLAIPPDLDFAALEGVTFEARQKLQALRPSTVGQASRMPGVSPADLSVLMLYLHRRRVQDAAGSRAAAEASA
jgi:tRNA uridine 5-carboxymethylaminomethyl modification enzyme